jgi:hypothetical protein
LLVLAGEHAAPKGPIKASATTTAPADVENVITFSFARRALP